jgi:hypothetical protein
MQFTVLIAMKMQLSKVLSILLEESSSSIELVFSVQWHITLNKRKIPFQNWNGIFYTKIWNLKT